MSGHLADFTRRNGYLSTKNTRKLFNSLGSYLPAGLVLLVGVVGCNHVTAVLTLTLCVGMGGFAATGYGVNHLDISPRFCGILLAITNGFGTIPGFLSPLLVGYLTNNNQTRDQWQIVFYVTAAIYVTGASIYVLLAQGEVLPWGGLNSAPVVSPESPAIAESESKNTTKSEVEDYKNLGF
ncbi:vesicular glutamate transporter 2 [Elysia marginata]|uniref:Vesicular glutamate transporter 2 n=1 Tax=Elysia marginata TaxID=1093978 RepID=A0AAV4JQY0_9GAST|nr:vesicular glutamate transporter 2 [Elysia marginata]